MLKKIIITVSVIVGLAIILIVLFGGYVIFQSRENDKINEMLISQCKNTNYKVKRLQKQSYKIKNDPNLDKLSVKIGKSFLYVDPGEKPLASISPNIFGNVGIFNNCSLKQTFNYQFIFNDQLTTKIDQKGEVLRPYSHDGDEKVATSFDRVSELFIEKNNLTNTNIEYNFEESFLSSFKIINKDNLTLYTEGSNNIFLVDNNSFSFIDTSSESNSSDFTITDFTKNQEKLEITFYSKNTPNINKISCFKKINLSEMLKQGKISPKGYTEINLETATYHPC